MGSKWRGRIWNPDRGRSVTMWGSSWHGTEPKQDTQGVREEGQLGLECQIEPRRGKRGIFTEESCSREGD